MDDLNSAASETEIEKLTSVAALEAGLTHPITYDVTIFVTCPQNLS